MASPSSPALPQHTPNPTPDVLIVGAGVAGLAAAIHLERAGLSCLLLEAADDLGGRIRTDLVPGPGGTYRLDRGFQIFLTAYPEGKDLLDYPALDFRPFIPGALSWTGDRFHRLSDPRRDGHWISNALSPLATPLDKLRAARLLLPLLRGNPLDLLPPSTPDDRSLTTLDFLRKRGFSDLILRRFFEPFLSGVLLDPTLSTSAGFTLFTLRMFATGQAVIPALGIGEIPRQLASKLRRSEIRLNAPVAAVAPREVLLASGHRLHARATLVATDLPAAAPLLFLPPPPPSRTTSTLYFSAPTAPISQPILLLDGQRSGPINHAAVPTLLAPELAPPGYHLISLSTVGTDMPANPNLTDPDLTAAALAQMTTWFGPQVRNWQHLRTYHIPHALPDASPAAKPTWITPPTLAPGLYRAGDALNSPSTQGALASARLASSVIVRDLA